MYIYREREGERYNRVEHGALYYDEQEERSAKRHRYDTIMEMRVLKLTYFLRIHMYMCACVYRYMNLYINTYIYIYMYADMYKYTHIYTYICVYIYVYIYAYKYISV